MRRIFLALAFACNLTAALSIVVPPRNLWINTSGPGITTSTDGITFRHYTLATFTNGVSGNTSFMKYQGTWLIVRNDQNTTNKTFHVTRTNSFAPGDLLDIANINLTNDGANFLNEPHFVCDTYDGNGDSTNNTCLTGVHVIWVNSQNQKVQETHPPSNDMSTWGSGWSATADVLDLTSTALVQGNTFMAKRNGVYIMAFSATVGGSLSTRTSSSVATGWSVLTATGITTSPVLSDAMNLNVMSDRSCRLYVSNGNTLTLQQWYYTSADCATSWSGPTTITIEAVGGFVNWGDSILTSTSIYQPPVMQIANDVETPYPILTGSSTASCTEANGCIRNTGHTTITFTHVTGPLQNIGGGATRGGLLVLVGGLTGGDTSTTVTWGGTSLTRILANCGGWTLQSFWLAAPAASTSHSVVVTFNNTDSSADTMTAVALSLDNVSQTMTTNTNCGSSSLTASLTAVARDLLVGSVMQQNQPTTLTAPAGWTQMINYHTGAVSSGAAFIGAVAAGTQTMTYTQSGGGVTLGAMLIAVSPYR